MLRRWFEGFLKGSGKGSIKRCDLRPAELFGFRVSGFGSV